MSGLAERCRWERLGYRDGEGTDEDIAARLEEYERCLRLWAKSEAALKEQITDLKEQLAR